MENEWNNLYTVIENTGALRQKSIEILINYNLKRR